MTQLANHRVSGNALATAPMAPIIGINNTAGKDGTIRADILSRHLKAEPVKAAKSSQVRDVEGSVEHEGLAVENCDLDDDPPMI